MKVLLLLLLLPLTLAIHDAKNIVGPLSFPDTIDLKGFQLTGDAILDTNRIVLTPKPVISSSDEAGLKIDGALWTAHPQQLGKFTTEFTLRSVGNYGKTGAELDIFLVESISDDLATFTGIKIQIDSNGETGSAIKSYLSDGSSVHDSNKFFSSCLFAYQGSQVPMIVKLSYDLKTLKLTIDNKICFESDQIKLDLGKIHLGVVGSSPKDVLKYEQFEVLKLKTYDEVWAEDSQQLLPQAKPVSNVQLFREQQQRLREKSQESLESKETHDSKDSPYDTLVNELLAKLDSLGTGSGAASQSNLVNMNTNKQLTEITKVIKVLQEKHNDLSQTLTLLVQSVLKVEAKVNALEGASSDYLGRMGSFDTRLLQFNSFMNFQKEANGVELSKLNSILGILQDLEGHGKQDKFHDKIDSLSSFMKFVLIPIFIVLIVLFMAVYRLRNDIKHSKIL
ncbi:unnamed protein product [Kuraishia capsulata CBS 1993]|uniref:L-type lectin-like domain-containing protein n=1 Tax=Kuraishia capsulata CBS 1993 TaxID=1382522 RepID=W6MPT3_9ASCO|nr:uncharacterized protein KUCA_T00004713001 [Kuraishia capsulata CBS 1993]CDK28729.1 unnamed protein product [Kuraishia capsulata CBS 1993]